MSQLTFGQAMQMAVNHHQGGQLQEAESLYRQILSFHPQQPEVLHMLGVLMGQRGRLEEAVNLIGQAIAIAPDTPAYYSNLGTVLHNQGKLDEAIAMHIKTISLNPNIPEAYYNLGNVYCARGRLDDALKAYQSAVVLRPQFAEAHCNMGNAWRDKGRDDKAIASYQQALALKPQYAEAHANLGTALFNQGQLDGAIASHRRALALDPNLPQSNLGNVLKDQGQLDEAIACYRQTLIQNPGSISAHDNLIFALHSHPASDRQSLFAEHRRWNQQHAEPLRHVIFPHLNEPNPDRPLRVGYVSPDLHEHAVARFLMPLLASRDRAAFQVFCYAHVSAPDSATEKLKRQADGWRDIFGLSDEQAAALIRDDEIDILVDLAMHSGDNRLPLFARKPAPVQVAYLAYAGGTGLAAMDYRFTDSYLDPDPADDQYYLEKSFRLEGTYWCYQPLANIPQVNPLPALDSATITVGCLNNFSKVTRPTLETWTTLLQQVPNTRLLLHTLPGSHRESLKRLMEDKCIAPERLQLVGRVSPAEYFLTYHQIDIGLDPFPYNGGTTTCDALWMGVPVVTLAGRTAVGRAGASILSNAGLPELIAGSREQYVEIVAQLAGDVARLADVRATLRGRLQISRLMDVPRYARSVEHAYRTMWRTWCKGAVTPPAGVG